MPPELFIILVVCAAAVIWHLNHQRLKYRKLWHETAEKLIAERAQANTPGGVMLQLSMAKKAAKHWNDMMHHAEDERDEIKRKEAQGRKELTRALETIDGLLHGDAQCCAGHRFYSPPGETIYSAQGEALGVVISPAKCPHCGAPKLDDLPTGKESSLYAGISAEDTL